MNRLHASLLLASLLLPNLAAAAPPASSASAANTSWYDIELIVFRYTDPQAGDLETWPADPGRPDWQTATPLVTLAGVPAANKNNAPASLTPFMQIDAHQLDSDWTRLSHSHDYQPLLHAAWMEPLIDHASAAAVQIGVPPAAPATTSATGSGITPLPPQPVQTVAAAASKSGVPGTTNQIQNLPPSPTPVYGSVKFSQYGPYLHFDVDLVCQGPIAKKIMAVPAATSVMNPLPAAVSTGAAATAQAGATTPYQWYRMTQDRRIEAGKLNYFDNPMFGVLVLVTPHQAPPAGTK